MAKNNPTDHLSDPDAPVGTYSTGNNGRTHPLETAGIRANRHKVFSFSLAGPEVYELCEVLRKVAVESSVYLDVATAVKYERLLFEQARDQGF